MSLAADAASVGWMGRSEVIGVSTVRVYDLATKFRLTTKEVLERLQTAGIEVATFSSSVEEAQAAEILSRPLARIPARTIRPGSGATIKPTTRRTSRAKTGATPLAR